MDGRMVDGWVHGWRAVHSGVKCFWKYKREISFRDEENEEEEAIGPWKPLKVEN